MEHKLIKEWRVWHGQRLVAATVDPHLFRKPTPVLRTLQILLG
jgi:hypothetical protein